MKRKLLIVVYLIALQSTVYAQGFADSLYFFRQDLKRIEFSYSGLTQLISSDLDKTSRLGLDFEAVNGHYRLAQEAESGSKAEIYTDGIKTLGKFKFAGHFSFGRVWQDSLKWSTKLNEDAFTPYYYGSIKAGKFERLAYDLGGMVSYQLNEKLYAGTGISYKYQSSARSVDPRASVKVFDLKVQPEIVYKIGGSLFGIGGTLGYATENISISYKNRDYMLSLGYPDRINYYLRGYGFLDRTRHGNQSDIKTSMTKGLHLSHSFSGERSTIQTKLSYDNLLERNGEELENSSRDTIRSEFVVKRVDLNFLYSYQGNNFQHQIDLSAGILDGFDRDLILLGSNYFYTRNHFRGDYLIRASRSKLVSPELGLGLNYEQVNRKDLSSAHIGSYETIEPSVDANLYLQQSPDDQFRLGVGVSYRHPLNNELSVPASQETVFTSGVIYPDQDFHGSKSLSGRADFSWFNNSVLEQFTLGINAALQYSSRLDEPDVWTDSTFVSDKSRLSFNFGVNLFF